MVAAIIFWLIALTYWVVSFVYNIAEWLDDKAAPSWEDYFSASSQLILCLLFLVILGLSFIYN